ncbi:acyltransferase [Microbacterium mangrovi]|uniref:Apolipoprotein N-acyltransferase n=1 Tax=Microbacterium mangrovi TaxID=1348253 RepID=A0A0B2A7F7_9MICO|nr:acyltransferase [Microbacterium mangrovi]
MLPLGIATFVSAIAGFLQTLAFPSLSWWPVVFLSVPLTLLPLTGRRSWSAFLVGFVNGLGFYLVNVAFTSRYLGPIPWLALSVLEALITAAMAIPIALAYRWLPRVAPGRWGRLVALPAVVAGLWIAREELIGHWPYGGFPWGRLGVTQVDSPLGHLLSWVGMSGVGFLIVFLCASAIEYARIGTWRDLRTAAPVAIVALVLLLVPQFPTTPAGTMRVGAAQGNGPTGYFDKRTDYAVLDAQVAATRPLLGQKMDLLAWPEGGVEYDPTQDAPTAAVLDGIQKQAGAPLLANAAVRKAGNDYNLSFLWMAGKGITQSYAKWHPVPFGEYVPDRSFWEPLAPSLIGLIGRGYTPGTTPPIVTVKGVGVGLAICFDVIYDDVIRTGARDGARLFVFQTNNADFRGTDENIQQLAFARARALETGRSVVNISTVGTSQVIAPDGSELDRIPADTAGHMLTDVPLRTGLTPAMSAGAWIDGILAWGSLAALALAGLIMRRRRRARAADATTPAPAGTGVDSV